MRKWFSQVMAIILPIGCALFLAMLFFAWWVPRYGDGMQRAMQVIHPDEILGWAQRSRLDTLFEGRHLITDEFGLRNRWNPPGGGDVIIMGPSSTFGWGVGQEETYSARLEKLIDNPIIRVANGGQIGFSLVQGRLLYRKLKQKKKLDRTKIVVLAYGVNDLDRFRFVGRSGETDSQYFARGGAAAAAKAWPLFEATLGEFLYRVWRESQVYRFCGNEKTPSLRVPINEFRDLLENFVEEIQADGKTPMLLGTAIHPGFFSVGLDGDLSERLYQASERASREGKCSESRYYFRSARKAEGARLLRDLPRINRAAASVAAKEGIQFLDLARLLGTRNEQRVNFYDAVHPSAAGHEKIARALVNRFRAIHLLDRINHRSGGLVPSQDQQTTYYQQRNGKREEPVSAVSPEVTNRNF